MAADLVSQRVLGRATLDRQLLLERAASIGVVEAVDHLVGLQAQVPRDPYVALWSRLVGFDPADVEELLLARELVRIVVLRGTIHLVTVADACRIRPLVRPVLDAEMRRHREHRDELGRVDVVAVAEAMRAFLATEPRTVPALRAELLRCFPDHDPAALALACRNVLALVQAPPRGLWQRSGPVALVTLESWTGRTLDAAATVDDLVLRYLAAFGPAAAADVAAWTRLTGLGEVMDRLRPRLRTWKVEGSRRTVFDLADASLPDPDVAAPVRFLPEYDNALLGHADRSRLGPDHDRRRFGGGVQGEPGVGSVLVDGIVAGAWSVVDGRIHVRHGRLTTQQRSEVEAEAVALGGFLRTAMPGLADDVVRVEV